MVGLLFNEKGLMKCSAILTGLMSMTEGWTDVIAVACIAVYNIKVEIEIIRFLKYVYMCGMCYVKRNWLL